MVFLFTFLCQQYYFYNFRFILVSINSQQTQVCLHKKNIYLKKTQIRQCHYSYSLEKVQSLMGEKALLPKSNNKNFFLISVNSFIPFQLCVIAPLYFIFSVIHTLSPFSFYIKFFSSFFITEHKFRF